MPQTTVVGAEVDGAIVDVRIEGDRVTAVGRDLVRRGTELVEAAGGALLPGLHDHHLHLLAMAAARQSVDLAGLDAVALDAAIAAAHRAAPRDAWLRAVGYDEARAGRLDRHRLDRVAPGRRVRVQHRSGAMWVLSSCALRALGIESATGELHRLDELVAERMERDEPDLAPVGSQLARDGVTGVTDATPHTDPSAFEVLAAARRAGALPQRVVVMGGPAIAARAVPGALAAGPVKIVVADNALPTIGELVAAIEAARVAARTVALHCVTRVGLILALSAWDEAGSVPGDRIEHGSVLPVELIAEVKRLGLTIVTQPGFVATRGDAYLSEVDADDQPHLYRCGSLIDAGVAVGGSTDAPFGAADPWFAIRTATDRRTARGAVLGPDERVSARRALGLFLTAPDDPGGDERRVEPGAAADLVLLHAPLGDVLRDPTATAVRSTWIGGERVVT